MIKSILGIALLVIFIILSIIHITLLSIEIRKDIEYMKEHIQK